MHIKTILCTAVLSALCLARASATDVTLVRTDNTGLIRDLATVARFELSADRATYRLVALSDGGTIVSGSVATLQRLSFVDENIEPSAPTAINAFSVENGNVRSRNADRSVRVYSISGRLVRTGDAGSVSTSDLPAGLYILTDGTNATKMLIK